MQIPSKAMIEHKRADSSDPLLVMDSTTMEIPRNRDPNQEFDFWGENRVGYNCKDVGSIHHQEISVPRQALTLDGFVFGKNSLLPVFGKNLVPFGNRQAMAENTREDSSPLLPHDHHYSNLSPRSRKRVIEQGRKEMMDMIKDLPDTFYELSLKDIVDEHQKTQQGTPEHSVAEESGHESKAKQNTTKPKKGIRPGQISRTSSLESETLRLRMFFPAFLASKKQPKLGKRSKVSPRPSVELPREKCVDKEPSKKNVPVAVGDQIKSIWGDAKGTRKSKSCTSRNPDDKFSSSCWPFGTTKSKLRRQKTCSF